MDIDIFKKFTPKQQKNIIFCLAVILIFLILFIIVTLMGNSSEPKRKKIRKKDIPILSTGKSDNAFIIEKLTSANKELKKINQENIKTIKNMSNQNKKILEVLEKIQNNINDKSNEIKHLKLELDKLRNNSSAIPPINNDDENIQAKIDSFKKDILGGNTQKNINNKINQEPVEFDLTQSFYNDKPNEVKKLNSLENVGQINDLLPNIVISKIEDTSNKNDDLLNKIEKSKKNIIYIPSTSIIKAVLLSGIDAPTHDNARSEPHPALLQIKGIVNMPSFKNFNLDSCRILTSCYGDLATHRAYFRTIKMSCIINEKVFDISIKGNIIGSDGKLGINGELVSKNGQMLALSLATSIFSGASDSLRPEKNIQIATDKSTQQYTTPPMKTVIQGGIFKGLSHSADTLSKYYLKLADSAHPVIEITPGKKCQIILTQGFSLNFNEKRGKL